MKASALLKEQHQETKTLFKQLEKGNGNHKAILEKLSNGLVAHMVIEQELFYPAVLNVKEDLVLESYEEHAVARFALRRLLKTPPSDPSFKAKLTTLEELIKHHVKEEEEDLFPKAEKALGEKSDPLCRLMKALFEETVEAGYERALGRGGAAVTSSSPQPGFDGER
jgi:iron-sulfur cluster repair protein YtfE (RIC family)